MSVNRRRWASELTDSIIDFQSKESSSINSMSIDSLDNKSTNMHQMPQPLSGKTNSTGSFEAFSEEHSACTTANYNSSNFSGKRSEEHSACTGVNSNSSNFSGKSSTCTSKNILNLSMTENEVYDLINFSVTSAESSNCLPDKACMNKRLIENNVSTDSETLKPSSGSTTIQNTMETKSSLSQQSIINEESKEYSTVSSDNGVVKLVHTPDDKSIGQIAVENSWNTPQLAESEDEVVRRFFSSPMEYSKTGQELIAEMDTPEIWDALVALDQALSPIEEHLETPENKLNDSTSLLTRLSQKFKKTPTRFTEKLVSIIEDSVISVESDSKPNSPLKSDVSLNRITGEFRKLCKYIEDESMPEWAPTLNMTLLDKTETAEKIDKPKNPAIKRILEGHGTPKSRINSKCNSPTTPSADKSFEYWETMCNLICKNQESVDKQNLKLLASPTQAKRSMDEMLVACERQLAMLDESVIDRRRSEPCKTFHSNVKASQEELEDTIFIEESKKVNSLEKNVKEASLEDTVLIESLQGSSDSEIEDDYQLSKKSKEINLYGKQVMENSFENCLDDREDSFSREFKPLSYEENDNQDCSLLIELAKRRQRCLDTAKLMKEIDMEDPTSSGDDTRCYETLVKLGNQDKTNVEEDFKFLDTLNKCVEYNNCLRSSSKPIINIIQTSIDSPELIKKSIVNNKKDSKSNQKLLPPKSSSKVPWAPKLVPKITVPDKSAHRLVYKNTPDCVKNARTPKPTNKYSSTLLPSRFGMKPTPRSMAKTPSQTISKQTPKLTLKQTPQTVTRPAMNVTPRISSKPVANVTPRVTSKPTPKPNTRSLSQSTPYSVKRDSVLNNRSALKTTNSTKVQPRTSQMKTQSNSFSSKKLSTQSIPLSNKVSTPSGNTSTYKKTPRSLINLNHSSAKPSLKPQSNVKVPSEKKFTNKNITPLSSSKPRLFHTPGKSPIISGSARKKPAAYFPDAAAIKKSTGFDCDSVKSPIGLYIASTDVHLIQNVQAKTDDRLLTPVSNSPAGITPTLKFKLSSKENKSPALSAQDDFILPPVRYQSAKKVQLFDEKRRTPGSKTPNSRTKMLLEPIENTVVIRHAGRVLVNDTLTNGLDSETSIRVQKLAEKTSSVKK